MGEVNYIADEPAALDVPTAVEDDAHEVRRCWRGALLRTIGVKVTRGRKRNGCSSIAGQRPRDCVLVAPAEGRAAPAPERIVSACIKVSVRAVARAR